VWRNGEYIFTTLVNTGITVAQTAVGTYPVYARYLVTTMTGKNPDGTPYSDPGIPWVSYFNGVTPCTATSGPATGFRRASAAWR